MRLRIGICGVDDQSIVYDDLHTQQQARIRNKGPAAWLTTKPLNKLLCWQRYNHCSR